MSGRLSLQEVAGLSFFTRTGRVVQSQLRTETVTEWKTTGRSVADPGGGGFTYRQETKPVAGRRVRNHFAIRDETGVDTNVAAVGTDVREGQTVTILYAGDAHASWTTAVGIYNHDSGKKTYLEEGIQAVRGGSVAQLSCLALLGGAVLTIVTLGLGLVVLVIWLLASGRRNARIEAAIRRRVDEKLRIVAGSR